MFDVSKIWGVPIRDSTYLIPSGRLVILGRFPLNFAHTFFRIDLLVLTFQCSLFGTKCVEDFRSYHTVALSFQGNEYLFNLPYGPSHWPVNPTSQCWDLGLGTPECLPLLQQVRHHCPAEDSEKNANLELMAQDYCINWAHPSPTSYDINYICPPLKKSVCLPPLDHYNQISHSKLQTVTKTMKFVCKHIS